MVDWKTSETVPTVKVVVTLVLAAAALVCRTQTVWPLLTVPVVEV